jgi:Arylmalonate decarboxylase
MVEIYRAKIGYLGPSAPSSPHIKKVLTLVPGDIEIVFEQLVLHDGRLSELRGKLDAIVNAAVELAEKHHLNGLVFPGAPREVLNPGLFARFSASLRIPVATALRASTAALRAFFARRVLLMTPFDESINKPIRDFLADAGIQGVSAPQTVQFYADAAKLTPADVEALTEKAVAQHPDVDAVYFQGGVLDPIDSLAKLESDLGIPVLASNPAMLWCILSKLGLKYEIPGFGRLLSSWPPLPND